MSDQTPAEIREEIAENAVRHSKDHGLRRLTVGLAIVCALLVAMAAAAFFVALNEREQAVQQGEAFAKQVEALCKDGLIPEEQLYLCKNADRVIEGAQGIQGVPGPQGAQGIEGPTGATGAQGPTGEQGEKGADGEKGEAGADGAAGATGAQGEPGPAGPQGEKGEKGDTGVINAVDQCENAGEGRVVKDVGISYGDQTVTLNCAYGDDQGGQSITYRLACDPVTFWAFENQPSITKEGPDYSLLGAPRQYTVLTGCRLEQA